MRRTRYLFVAALFIAVAAAFFPEPGSAAAPATAFPPPNDRWIQHPEWSTIVPLVAATGELTWSADVLISDEVDWPAWRGIVARALDTGSDYAQSLGNVLAPWVTIRPAGWDEVAMVRNRAVSSGFVEAKCGSAWATACVYVTDPIPVDAVYKAVALMQWTFVPQAAVIEHEVFHPLAWACDQYLGGCPPTDGEALTCTGNPESLMDCGLAARYPQPFDIGTFLGAYTPDHPAYALLGLGDGVQVEWTLVRADGGYAHWSEFNDTATEVAFAFWRSGGEPEWVGALGCGAEWDFCYTPPSAGGRWFGPYWTANFDCVAIRFENEPTRFVPQSSSLGLDGSAPHGYWYEVGCWR